MIAVHKQYKRIIQELQARVIEASIHAQDMKLDGEDYNSGIYFGAYQGYFDISGTLSIPSDWEDVVIAVETDSTDLDNAKNPQFKFFVDEALCATFDANHKWYRITDRGLINFKLNIFTGNTHLKFPVHIRALKVNRTVESFIHDLDVLSEALNIMDDKLTAFHTIQNTLQEALQNLDVDAPSPELKRQIVDAQKILEKIYTQEDDVATLYAVGHTHIDIAWLWTVEQAIEKGERSFTTILNLLDEYPEFTFIQSQPQLYEFIEKKNPILFEKMRKAIQEGRWEAEGGMWVESDTTLVSGESLVRQFLYGKTYFKEKFGVDNKVLWLPDVFGYAASLPQIMAQSGIDYFMTTKLSWNQYNQIPNDTFMWKGIDGTEILTHFITTPGTSYQPRPWYTTYNGLLEVPSMKGSWDRYQQKNINKDLLIAYGYGDGGGGPTEAMIETGLRMAKGIPSLPRIKFGGVREYFDRLKNNLQGKRVPKWSGELYFEYHRGTYTSRADNKKSNRKLENALQSLEKISVFQDFEIDQLDAMWKVLLLNQFHDIIPGTSIAEVYQVSDQEYRWIETTIQENLQKSLPVGSDVVVFNPLSLKHQGLVKDYALQGALTQTDAYGRIISRPHSYEAFSWNTVKLEKAKQKFEPYAAPRFFETPYYTVEFNEAFEIQGLYDRKAGRECIPKGKLMNQLRLYEDLPMDYDAWDLDAYYEYKHWRVDAVTQAQCIDDGPIRLSIEISRDFGHSSMVQIIHFYKDSPLIEFETQVDWCEHGKILKTDFALNVNANHASFDIPFGVIERPTHNNTSWDIAQFEVNAQKWADISEGNYGFALMNDCKYGYHAKENHLGLSLLRSSNEPFIDADKGQHHFTYALLPHSGSWKEADVMEASYQLNNPLQVFENTCNKSYCVPIEIQEKGIYVDTVKKAQGSDDVIVRLYEYFNEQHHITLNVDPNIRQLYRCDVLENMGEAIKVVDGKAEIMVKPFEIVSVRGIYD